MPGDALFARTRILQWLELEALVRQSDPAAVVEQSVPVGGDQVRHATAEPDVAMKPETAIHRMDHPVAATGELARLLVRRGVVRHDPTIARRLLAEELALDGGRRQGRHGADEHRALDRIRQRVRNLG